MPLGQLRGIVLNLDETKARRRAGAPTIFKPFILSRPRQELTAWIPARSGTRFRSAPPRNCVCSWVEIFLVERFVADTERQQEPASQGCGEVEKLSILTEKARYQGDRRRQKTIDGRVPCKDKHTDLSKGDEVSTAAQLYLQKVRAFYFTLDQAFALWDAIRRPVLSYFSCRRLK